MPAPRVFSEADIRQLLRAPSPAARAAMTHRLCVHIDTAITPDERAAAGEVLRLMASDAAEIVRRALAVTLRSSERLPRDVAVRLAHDVDAIAVAVLTFSPVFTDEDLGAIVRTTQGVRQLAVARRPELSKTVCGVIASHGEATTVAAALANAAASFDEGGLQIVLDRFPDQEPVTSSMAYRRVLPLAVAERLVALVGETVRSHLVDHHALAPEIALEIAVGARERATLDLIDQAGRTTDVAGFVAHLHAQRRLTPSLVLRALAHGHVAFMEHALAKMAGVAHHRAWLLVHDAGPLGLKAICDKAKVPEASYPAFRAGLDSFRSLQLEGVEPAAMTERMLERVLTRPAAAPGADARFLVQRVQNLRASRRS